MSKLLYCNDLHGKAKNSRNRLGNYFSDWLLKIDEVLSIAKKNKCEAIICGGDVYDSPNVSNSIVDEFLDRIENTKIHWHIVPGNHDLVGHNWAVSQSSSLAHMFRRSKYVHRLEDLQIDDTRIQGFEYYHGIENDIKEKGLMVNDGKLKIAVTHAFISIKPFHPDVLHVLAKDIDTNANIVLCSHFHENWGVYDIKNFKKDLTTRFVNIGAFGRLSITEAKHTPQVAIVDTETQLVEIIKLQSAKKAEEIFDLTKHADLKGTKRNMKEFLDSLRDVNFQSMDVGQQVVKIGKQNEVGQDVIDYTLQKLEECRNE